MSVYVENYSSITKLFSYLSNLYNKAYFIYTFIYFQAMYFPKNNFFNPASTKMLLFFPKQKFKTPSVVLFRQFRLQQLEHAMSLPQNRITLISSVFHCGKHSLLGAFLNISILIFPPISLSSNTNPIPHYILIIFSSHSRRKSD